MSSCEPDFDCSRANPNYKLKADLDRLAEELDWVLRARDVNRYGEHASTYLERYRSIEKALEAAGFSVHSKVNCGPGDVRTDAILDDLRRLGEELGRPPKASNVEAAGEFSLSTYHNYFNRFGDALSQAGFPAEEENMIPVSSSSMHSKTWLTNSDGQRRIPR